MSQPGALVDLLRVFTQWASMREDVVALALAGSHARGEARPDSDVDLLVFATDPPAFRSDSAWVEKIDWHRLGLRVLNWHDKDYGAVWSRHLLLTDVSNTLEVEVSFALPDWANTNPVDPGTLEVVRGGFRVVFDPSGILHTLVRSVG